MRVFRISGLFILYLLLCSKGCDDREAKTQQKETAALEFTQDSVLAKFQSDILPEVSLRAFEENAKQKLVDFADYFSIMCDTSLDSSFRKQAEKMIKDMFYRDDLQLELTLPGKQEMFEITLEKLLNMNFLSKYNKSELTFDSIYVSEFLHMDKTARYTGKLTFRQGFKALTGKDLISIKPIRKNVSVFVTKYPKPFGKDTMKVWEVFLGEITD